MTTDNDNRHPSEKSRFDYDYDSRRKADTPQLMRIIFAIFMVVVYVGVGILLFINFFEWRSSFDVVRYIGAAILVAYGLSRGYRYIKGVD